MPGTVRTAYLLLDVAGTPCALAREAVAEVLPLPELFAPPAADGMLAGFLNLGGRPVPVVDLARLLGLGSREPGLYAHLVLAASREIAFLVDRATDVVSLEAGALRPVAPERTLNGCVEAELALRDRLVHLLGLDRLLTAEESARLSALAQAARERLAALPAV